MPSLSPGLVARAHSLAMRRYFGPDLDGNVTFLERGCAELLLVHHAESLEKSLVFRIGGTPVALLQTGVVVRFSTSPCDSPRANRDECADLTNHEGVTTVWIESQY